MILDMTTTTTANDVKNTAVRFVEAVLFNIKWLLPFFYLGLVVVLAMYFYAFVKELYHLVLQTPHLSTDEMKVIALDMVDVTMISNLIKMIITGSYNSFISKEHGRKNEQITSGMLKIKIATSVIVVALIHLLQGFVSDVVNWDLVFKKLDLFAAFLAAALVLGVLEYLHIKSEVLEKEHEH